MDFFYSERVAKLFTAVSAIVVILLVAILLVTGTVLYGVLSPDTSGTALDPHILLGNPRAISVSGPGMPPRDAVFFPGQIGGPTIILAHGYRSHASALLTLVAAFQDNNYNVVVFDFSGHGGAKGTTTLGYKETRELLAVVDAVAQRDDVDKERIGVWGTGMGAYAAVAAASQDSRIRAFAADSLYDSPLDALRMELQRGGPGNLPVIRTLCRWGFKLINFSYRNEAPLSRRLPAMTGTAKLFIQGRDNPALADSTLALFLTAAEPRQQMVAPKSDFSTMTDEEKRVYEKEVVGFFLQNIPPVFKPRTP